MIYGFMWKKIFVPGNGDRGEGGGGWRPSLSISCDHVPLRCLYLIMVSTYSRVTIIRTAVIDYQIKITLISILILKTFDSIQKLKRLSSQSSLQAFKEYICI